MIVCMTKNEKQPHPHPCPILDTLITCVLSWRRVWSQHSHQQVAPLIFTLLRWSDRHCSVIKAASLPKTGFASCLLMSSALRCSRQFGVWLWLEITEGETKETIETLEHFQQVSWFVPSLVWNQNILFSHLYQTLTEDHVTRTANANMYQKYEYAWQDTWKGLFKLTC